MTDMKIKDAVVKSWRTSAMGVIQAVVIILPQVGHMLDSDTATNADWNIVAASLATLFALLFARDNNVSSESAGAK